MYSCRRELSEEDYCSSNMVLATCSLVICQTSYKMCIRDFLGGELKINIKSPKLIL
jgi:hypothetical protein